MANFNQSTTYLVDGDVLRGSAIVSFSPYQASPSYTPVGAIIDLSVQRNIETTEEQTDNSPGDQRIFNETATVSMTRCEALKHAVTQLFAGDSDTFANTAAAPVAGATQTIAANWTNLQTYPLTNLNSDGTVPTINSVTASSTGALAAEDDYFITRGADGIWTIAFDTAGTATVATTESVIVDSDHTPAASTLITYGTGRTLTKCLIKIVANNRAGREVTETYFKCQLETRDAISWAADDAEDARYLEPLTFTCLPDGLYNSDAVGSMKIDAS